MFRMHNFLIQEQIIGNRSAANNLMSNIHAIVNSAQDHDKKYRNRRTGNESPSSAVRLSRIKSW